MRALLLAALILLTACPPWEEPDEWDCNTNPHADDCVPVERQPRPDGAPEGHNLEEGGELG